MIAPCFSGGGMRLKIVEAMQYSKPVVTTPIGAEGLGVKSAKNILIGHSSADFVQHIDHLLKSPDFYFKIANNALLFVQKNFDNMKITEDLCEFYIKNLS